MRVHVINLAAATTRRAHIERVLSLANIRFERFDAIDAEQARRHRCFSQIPRMAEPSWTPDEIGCLLSHYEIWCRIAAGREPFGAVLEDDLFVDPMLKSVLDAEREIPRDADLVKLESNGGTISVSRLPRYRYAGIGFHRLRSIHYGTGAYLVSRKAAGVLVGAIDAFDVPVDNALFSPTHAIGRRIKVYQAIPALAVQSVRLPDASRRPELASAMERKREAAREFAQARQRGLDPAGPDAPAPDPAQSPRGLAAAVLRKSGALKQSVFEKSLVVAFRAGVLSPISAGGALTKEHTGG